MNKKKDTRYIATEEKIRTVFYDMLVAKEFSEIKTTDIIASAGIHKSTFYSHYEDKYDLLNCMENALLDGFFAVTEEISAEDARLPKASAQLHNYYVKFAEYILMHRKEFQVLFHERSESRIVSKIAERIRAAWGGKNLGQSDTVFNAYILSASTSFVSGIIQEWIRRDFKETTEEFASMVQVMADNFRSAIL